MRLCVRQPCVPRSQGHVSFSAHPFSPWPHRRPQRLHGVFLHQTKGSSLPGAHGAKFMSQIRPPGLRRMSPSIPISSAQNILAVYFCFSPPDLSTLSRAPSDRYFGNPNAPNDSCWRLSLTCQESWPPRWQCLVLERPGGSTCHPRYRSYLGASAPGPVTGKQLMRGAPFGLTEEASQRFLLWKGL